MTPQYTNALECAVSKSFCLFRLANLRLVHEKELLAQKRSATVLQDSVVPDLQPEDASHARSSVSDNASSSRMSRVQLSRAIKDGFRGSESRGSVSRQSVGFRVRASNIGDRGFFGPLGPEALTANALRRSAIFQTSARGSRYAEASKLSLLIMRCVHAAEVRSSLLSQHALVWSFNHDYSTPEMSISLLPKRCYVHRAKKISLTLSWLISTNVSNC